MHKHPQHSQPNHPHHQISKQHQQTPQQPQQPQTTQASSKNPYQQTHTSSNVPSSGPSSSRGYNNKNSTNLTLSMSTSLSTESPLPPVVQRCLGDRSYEKRKNAALEIEALIKSLMEASNQPMIRSIIAVLSKDFCTSMNANYRKGGLIGIAAVAIGLMHFNEVFLNELLPPVLQCFDDPESRVRYYACESLYNIAKVARNSILNRYFNPVFDGLCKLFADTDNEVKNGAGLLDRLLKDIVTETQSFNPNNFIPLIQNYIRRTNPYIRQLLIGWITILDSVPDINMIDHLPDFLDGLFNMLSDSNREIRQAADSALSDFLSELRRSAVVEFGPIISILVEQTHSKERLNRLTTITWISELIRHPHSGGDALLPFHAEILTAIMTCLSDPQVEIRQVAERTNIHLLDLVRKTNQSFQISLLLDTLKHELDKKNDIPTQIAALKWINMLLDKHPKAMNAYISNLLPVLLKTLTDSSDDVVLLTLQVLSRIAIARTSEKEHSDDGHKHKKQFQMVMNAILSLFARDPILLEQRGALIIRKLCVLLDAETVYITLAKTLISNEQNENHTSFSIDFIGKMVQTLNLILLSAPELHSLRSTLENNTEKTPKHVFQALFHCWCHNPVSTFSLCLLAKAYDVAYALIHKFSEMDVTVGFLMQLDKLVQLLESPIFIHLRVELLDVEAPYHNHLLKSCYGLLMLLPQTDAFRTLNNRLTAVCHLRDNLGLPAMDTQPLNSKISLDSDQLLERFDHVIRLHSTSVSTSLPKQNNDNVMSSPLPNMDHRKEEVRLSAERNRNTTNGNRGVSHFSSNLNGGRTYT